MFQACGFVLVGDKNNTQDDIYSAITYGKAIRESSFGSSE